MCIDAKLVGHIVNSSGGAALHSLQEVAFPVAYTKLNYKIGLVLRALAQFAFGTINDIQAIVSRSPASVRATLRVVLVRRRTSSTAFSFRIV